MIVCIRKHNFKLKGINILFAPGMVIEDPQHQSWALEADYGSHIGKDPQDKAIAVAAAQGAGIRTPAQREKAEAQVRSLIASDD
ncbi:MAG: hypothetical protein AAGB02_03130 [Pseudomonadota bacterium]